MVVAGILFAFGLVALDRNGVVPQWLIDSPWLYNGGGTGARTLLGAVASSMIGVAGTVFSITIAALSQLDTDGLADWAAEHGATVCLLIRTGDYVFPGAPIAAVSPTVEGAKRAVCNATALGGQRVSAADLEFAVRQLVEVAVRALSPGINDPHTAISVLDRLGAAL
jgi:uncharacterized membrane protein